MKVYKKHNIKTLLIIAFLLLSTAGLAGCDQEADVIEPTPVPVPSESDYVDIKFTMPMVKPSRADINDHPEVDSSFPSFENFINPNDIGIFIFLGESDNAPLVGKWVLLAQSKEPYISITGYGSYYVIALRIKRERLQEISPGINIGPNSSDVIKFRVVVLANQKFNSTKTNDYADYDGCNTYKELIAKAETIQLKLGTNFYPTGHFTATIPMFGMRLFEVRADDLYYTAPYEVINLGEILLVRSMVKFRCIDSTVKNGGYPQIIVDSKGYNPTPGIYYVYRELFNLPANALTYANGVQPYELNLCTSGMNAGTAPNLFNLDNVPGMIYSAYIPEQKVSMYMGNRYPYFIFYYKKDLQSALTIYDRKIELDGTTLPDGSSGLLRNHIYTIEITNDPAARSGDGSDLQVNVSHEVW